jgi:hypothetical protein
MWPTVITGVPPAKRDTFELSREFGAEWAAYTRAVKIPWL